MEIFSPLFALQAEELLLLGDYKTAETMCREGLNHYPDYVAAQSLLALSLIKQNKIDEAHTLAETLNARSKKAAEAIRANLNNDSILQLYVDKEEVSSHELHDTNSWDQFEEILVDTQQQSEFENSEHTDSKDSELSNDSSDNHPLETKATPNDIYNDVNIPESKELESETEEEIPYSSNSNIIGDDDISEQEQEDDINSNDEVADNVDIPESIETEEESETEEKTLYSSNSNIIGDDDISEQEQKDDINSNDEVADNIDIPESIETETEVEIEEETPYSADPVGFESDDISESKQENEVISNDDADDAVIPETDNIKEDVDIIDEYSLISSLYEVESDQIPSADRNDIGIVPGFETILQDNLLSVLEADIFDDSKSITDELSELAKKLESSTIPIEHNVEDDEPEENEYRSEVISETLAKIYEMQGAYNDAITAYRKLAEIEPSRKEVYEEKIENILSKINN